MVILQSPFILLWLAKLDVQTLDGISVTLKGEEELDVQHKVSETADYFTLEPATAVTYAGVCSGILPLCTEK